MTLKSASDDAEKYHRRAPQYSSISAAAPPSAAVAISVTERRRRGMTKDDQTNDRRSWCGWFGHAGKDNAEKKKRQVKVTKEEAAEGRNKWGRKNYDLVP